MWILEHSSENKNTQKSIIYNILLIISGFLMAISFVLILSSKFRIPWSFDGSIVQGIISSWNDMANTLGSVDFIILPSFNVPEGVSGGEGWFLLITTFVLSVSGFFLIKGGLSWSPLLFLVGELFVTIISSLEIHVGLYTFAFLTIINAIIIIKTKDYWQSFLSVILIAIIFSSLIIVFPSEPLTSFNESLKVSIRDGLSDAYFGEDPLGHGDLGKRERDITARM